jgi:hypothetical protein
MSISKYGHEVEIKREKYYRQAKLCFLLRI